MSLRIISRLRKKLNYLLNKQVKPEMVGQFKTQEGNILKNTRISNLTHISHKHNFLTGDHVFIGHFNYIDCYCKVSIGKGCQITNFISILTHSSHDAVRLLGETYIKASKIDGLKMGEVSIGEYSYIGAHSVIMPGSKLGKGVIVSAFSYVEGTFPDYAILRGIPAKIVGSTKDRDKKLLREFPELKSSYYDNQ